MVRNIEQMIEFVNLVWPLDCEWRDYKRWFLTVLYQSVLWDPWTEYSEILILDHEE